MYKTTWKLISTDILVTLLRAMCFVASMAKSRAEKIAEVRGIIAEWEIKRAELVPAANREVCKVALVTMCLAMIGMVWTITQDPPAMGVHKTFFALDFVAWLVTMLTLPRNASIWE